MAQIPEGFQPVQGGSNLPEGFIPAGEAFTQPEPETSVSRLGDVFVEGLNVGLANLIGLPGELAAAAIRPFDEELAEKFGVANVQQLGREAGVIRDIEPTGRLERIVGGAGEVIGGSAIPGLGLTGALARRGTSLAVGARPAAETVGGAAADVLGRGIAANPVVAAAAEIVSQTGAGAGVGLARELDPGDPTTETLAGLAGGFAPVVLLQGVLGQTVRGTKGLVDRFSPSAQQQRGNRIVRELVGDLSEAELANVARSTQLREEIPGFAPTVAEQTAAPAIIRQQIALESNLSGPALEAEIARRTANRQAVNTFAQQRAPQSQGEDIDFVINTATRRVDDLRGQVEAQQAATQAAREEIPSALPRIDRTVTGEAVRDTLSVARKDAQAQMTALADELGINDADVTVSFERLGNQVIDDFNQIGLFRDKKAVPDVVLEIRDALDGVEIPTGTFGPDGTEIIRTVRPRVTFNDLKNLRERISDDLINEVSGATPNRGRIRALTRMKVAFDRGLASLEEIPQELAGNYRQFLDTYFTEFVNRFEKGAAFEVLKRGSRGFLQTTDERVANQFFRAGDITSARQFKDILGNNPEAVENLAATIFDDLSRVAVKNGVLNETAYNNWVRRHATVLEEFPEIFAEVREIGRANQGLLARAGQLDQRAKTIDQNSLVRLLDSFNREAQVGGNVMSKLINDPRLMQRFVNSIRGNEAAERALRRNIWNDLNLQTADQMRGFIEANEQSLKIALGEQHFDDILTINDAMRTIERTPLPPGTAESFDPIAGATQRFGISPQQLTNRVFQIRSGLIGARYGAIDVFSRFFRKLTTDKTDAVLTEALYDPEVATLLAQTANSTTPATQAQSSRLNSFLFGLGLTGLEEEDGR